MKVLLQLVSYNLPKIHVICQILNYINTCFAALYNTILNEHSFVKRNDLQYQKFSADT